MNEQLLGTIENLLLRVSPEENSVLLQELSQWGRGAAV